MVLLAPIPRHRVIRATTVKLRALIKERKPYRRSRDKALMTAPAETDISKPIHLFSRNIEATPSSPLQCDVYFSMLNSLGSRQRSNALPSSARALPACLFDFRH